MGKRNKRPSPHYVLFAHFPTPAINALRGLPYGPFYRFSLFLITANMDIGYGPIGHTRNPFQNRKYDSAPY